MSDSTTKLPPKWRITTIGAVCSKPQYGWTTSATDSGEVKLLRTTDITHGPVDWNRVPFCQDAPPDVEKYLLAEGDIVVSRAGSVGVSCRIVAPKRAVFASYLIRFRPKEDVDGKYLTYILQSPAYWAQVRGCTAGIAVPNVNASKLEAFTFPIAPLPEQRRIVAEIEKQFSRLEEGVSALKRVQANLKRYRAAVLKAACEGKLVENEVKSKKVKGKSVETGQQLLKQILEERRKKWSGRGKYKEPTAPDTSKLPPLPTSWSWVSWEMVLANEEGAFKRGPFGSALTKAIFVDKGFKVYEQYCPINDDCSFARYYITPEKFEELRGFEVKSGDYLISCSGVTLGRITRVPEKFEQGIINQALLRVRLNESVIDNKYFLHLFRSALFQKALFDNSTGSAIPNVKGVKELKAMAIPLPPLAEQKRIVEEVERRLSVVEELESLVTTNLQRASRLWQAVLQKAFEGELV
jgi:type I restriction enzyme, S subunit